MPAHSKCTPERWTQALELAAQGRFKTHVAKTIGVDRETLRDWLDGDPARALAYAAAEAVGEEVLLANALAGGDIGKAAQWYLEKLHPARYGKPQRHEVTGKGGAPIEVASLTPDERRARIAELIAKRDADRPRGD